MGSGSSVVHNNERQSTVKKERKSIRDQFHKEFGTRVSETNISNGAHNKETLNAIVENGETSSAESAYGTGKSISFGDSISENSGSISGNRDRSASDSNSNTTNGSSVYHVPAGRASLVSGHKFKFNAAVFRAKALFLKPVLKNRPEKDTLVVKKQNNPGLLKEMYQRMDPSLHTELANVVVGELEVAVKFKPEDNILLIKIGRGKDLPKEDGSPAPDPFVVADLFLAMNPMDLTTRKTKVKFGTCHPYFQEILTFPMTQQCISVTKLRITVWDKESSSKDIFLGESLHDICKLDFNSGGIAWYKLFPKTDIAICGNLEVCVTFNEPRSLLVTLNKGNNVKVCNEEHQTSNPYARVHATGLPAKFQTNVQYSTVNPVWMESFEFDVHPSEFSRRTIVINLFHKNTTSGRDQHLGDIHIPMTEYDYEEANISKEYILQDLRNTQHSKSAWSEEGLAMEFREAMRAHMIYGYPKFIFKKHHKGKMVVSCQSKKAHTTAKMVIDNGIVTMDNVQM